VSVQLSVVIPFYNEGDNVAALLEEVREALRAEPEYEVIGVDDGSRDHTLDALRAVRERGVSELRILRHPRNLGQSAAIVSGVRAARGIWIATMDGDGQNDPADLPRLLALARARGPVVVAGHRRRRQDSWLRRLSSRVANAVRGWLLADRTPDTGCGLKLFPRERFLDLPAFDHMHRFLPALFQRAGCMVVSVEVNHRPRTRGRSKYGLHNRLWVGIVDLLGVLWLRRRPLAPAADED
jgi:dolichol-phosphate mannosyltransferase